MLMHLTERTILLDLLSHKLMPCCSGPVIVDGNSLSTDIILVFPFEVLSGEELHLEQELKITCSRSYHTIAKNLTEERF